MADPVDPDHTPRILWRLPRGEHVMETRLVPHAQYIAVVVLVDGQARDARGFQHQADALRWAEGQRVINVRATRWPHALVVLSGQAKARSPSGRQLMYSPLLQVLCPPGAANDEQQTSLSVQAKERDPVATELPISESSHLLRRKADRRITPYVTPPCPRCRHLGTSVASRTDGLLGIRCRCGCGWTVSKPSPRPV